ncbi:MAG: hypothetical protein H0X37_23330 [Herpetosiphonaceae bacterium]|nr:hypothetical protein [Herpetosiphonaceae bacterium]
MPFQDRDQPPAPKPYTLIDLPDANVVTRSQPVGHAKIDGSYLTGRVRFDVEALSSVHVSSGLLRLTEDRRQPLVKALVRVDGVPVVPGSSFKGCVRSVVEAISRSCVRATRSREVPSKLQGCNRKESVCVACQLFGAQDLQALVRFSDMRQTAGDVEVATVPQLFRPRPQEGPYVFQRSVRGRKFYMHGARQAQGDGPIEVCATGSSFAGQIDFTNLSRAQLGLLLVALGQHPNYPLFLKLGGAKPACYGSVRVDNVAVDVVSVEQRYLQWDAGPDSQADIAGLINEAQQLLLQTQLAAVVETLKWPNDRDCPSGTY